MPFAVSAELKNVLPASELARITCAYASEDLQFSWGTMLCFFAAVRDAPSMQWLQISWIGIDFPMFKHVTHKPHLTITNAAGTNAGAVATSVLAAVLSLNRGLDQWMRAQLRGEWLNRELLAPRHDIAGQSALVYGFGAIGMEVARMLTAVGMKVTGMRRSVHQVAPSVAEEVAPSSELLARVATADFVVICCPLTDVTRHVFNGAVFDLMKPTACLVNVGRGAVVDEGDLVRALETGQIAGAYLDVFVQEPLPADHPLWALPNVILSPHDSASCVDNAARVQTIFLRNLRSFGRCARPISQNLKQIENIVWESEDLKPQSRL